MKIVGCRIAPLPGSARGALELLTDEGPVGLCVAPAEVAQAARQVASEVLVDTDPRAISAAWQRLSYINQVRNGALGEAIAALDIALWDLKAKLADQPLWRALGGLRPHVNVHMRVPAYNDTAQFNEWCVHAASNGIRAAVLSSSGEPEWDTSQLVTIRDAFSDRLSDFDLMLDARAQWSPKQAVRALRRIERTVDLAWVEAATHSADFLGLKRISSAIRAGVCAGGQLRSAADYLPHLHHRSLDYVHIDTSRIGISEALRIADAAYAFELPVVLAASAGNLNVHLAAALPYCASVEVSSPESLNEPGRGRALDTDVRIEHGRAVTGTRPGHGIVVDWLVASAAASSTLAAPA